MPFAVKVAWPIFRVIYFPFISEKIKYNLEKSLDVLTSKHIGALRNSV